MVHWVYHCSVGLHIRLRVVNISFIFFIGKHESRVEFWILIIESYWLLLDHSLFPCFYCMQMCLYMHHTICYYLVISYIGHILIKVREMKKKKSGYSEFLRGNASWAPLGKGHVAARAPQCCAYVWIGSISRFARWVITRAKSTLGMSRCLTVRDDIVRVS